MSKTTLPDSPLHYLGVAELAAGYRQGLFSPVEVARAYLQRIEALDHKLGAYITVAADLAMKAAAEAERALSKGEGSSPLLGVPVGLKDNIDTMDMPTTYGTAFRRGQLARQDAALVHRLRRHGAALLGKHNLIEFAMGGVDHNPHYGVIHNPWALERFTGGSSSGTAAAVAAGLCAAGVGSDTGGSIRQPSAYNGITGFKPSYGLVSLRGVFPRSLSVDTAGPMARSAEDAAVMLQAMAGYDPSDPSSARGKPVDYLASLRQTSLKGVRVGVDRGWVEEAADHEIARLWEQAASALQDLGATLVEGSFPLPRDLREMYRDIVGYEAVQIHEEMFEAHGSQYGPAVRSLLEGGRSVTLQAHQEALRRREELMAAADRFLAGIDVLAVPTQPTAAPLLGSGTIPVNGTPTDVASVRGRFTLLANFARLPALTVPMGLTSEGLPGGMQIVARAFEDAAVLRVGHAYQQVTGFHRLRPPLEGGGG